MDYNVERINRERETIGRILPIEAGRGAGLYSDRAAQGNASIDNQDGYWSGATFVSFFRLGVSALGGADVLK